MSVYVWNTFCPTLFGTGALKETGKKAKELGMHRVMVCTEKALCDFNVATQVIDVLKEEELEVFVFDKSPLPGRAASCPSGR